jgi:hypothetical protein
MSYGHEQNKKREKLIKMIKENYTIKKLKALDPNKKSDKKIIDAVHEYHIALRVE